MKTIEQIRYLETNLEYLLENYQENRFDLLYKFKYVVVILTKMEISKLNIWNTSDIELNTTFKEMLKAWPPNEPAPSYRVFGL